MQSFRIKPILGLVNNVAHNDPVLFKPFDGGAATHCVDCENIDLKATVNSCTKAPGKTEWSNSANAQATKCLGLFELKGDDHIFFDNGKMYVYDSSRDPVEKAHGTPVTMANDDADLYSMIQYGDEIIWTDFAEHEPYHWANGDANFVEFQTTSSYQCRYLELFQRVMLAYTTETNGDIEIRWTSRLPTAGSENIDAGNQLYKETNEPITGIKAMTSNRCMLYDDRAITAIDYYPNYTTPFAMTTLVTNGGSANHHSIIPVSGRHFLFSPQYGFCAYAGTTEFPFGGRPISEPIESTIATINQNYYNKIVGTFLPQLNQLVWAVPLDGVTSPSHLLIFDLSNGNWIIEEKASRFIDNWKVTSDIVWSDLSGLGYTTWSDFGQLQWGELFSSAQQLVLGDTDGKTYYSAGDSDDGNDYEGFRIEPILPLTSNGDKTLLTEVWFSFSRGGDFSIDLYHRSGDTVYETQSAGWTALDPISCNSPANAVAYTAKHGRYHQLKWGTDKKNERFAVDEIVLKHVPQGPY